MTRPPTSESGLLGVVVVNYGSHEMIADHLGGFGGHLGEFGRPDEDGERARSGDPSGIRVIVVDNFHSTRERAAITALAAGRGWELVAPVDNPGYGEGNNQGVARAFELGCDVVLLLNPDARIAASDCLEMADFARRTRRALISPVITRPDGSIWFAGSEFSTTTGRVRRSQGQFVSGPNSWLTGACLMIHREMWLELGGFAPGYFMYWEDVEISRRCVDLGGELVVLPGVRAEHDAGGTQAHVGGSGKSAMYYRYNCRNRLLFAAAHMSTPDLWRWVWHTPVESSRILLRGGRRQFITDPLIIWPALRGTLEGLWIVVKALKVRHTANSRRPAQRR